MIWRKLFWMSWLVKIQRLPGRVHLVLAQLSPPKASLINIKKDWRFQKKKCCKKMYLLFKLVRNLSKKPLFPMEEEFCSLGQLEKILQERVIKYMIICRYLMRQITSFTDQILEE